VHFIGPGVTYHLNTDAFEIASNANVNRPLSICIHVNRRCNLLCSYCLSDSGPVAAGGVGTLRDSLKLLLRWSPLRLVWSGGEPMLQSGLENLLAIGKSAGSINILTTNGTLVPPETLIPLIDWLDVSLHGVNASTFQSVTERNHFDLVMRNLAVSTNRVPRVSASLVIIRPFLPEILVFAQKLRDIGIKRLRISRLLSLGRGIASKDDDPIDSEVADFGQRLLELLPEVSIVLPAVRKRAATSDGYLVLENDGTLSSPPVLFGKSLDRAIAEEDWSSVLASHRFLFDGTKD
jgi:molybdenum cofactor biosynthesis enzyme MoaA